MSTRSSAKKQEAKQKELKANKEIPTPKQEPVCQTTQSDESAKLKSIDKKKELLDKTINVDVGSASEKCKMDDFPKSKSIKSTRKSKASGSARSSVVARKKLLELEAAEAKARIQMELIDKKLAADLAQLDEENEEYSSQSEASEIHTSKEVEKWLERSHLELKEQPVPPTENTLDKLCPPPAPLAAPARDGTEDTVHLLATALKDIAAVSSTNGPNARMLSRLCTPRDLPSFSGDPMEWLQFKQAYDESTEVCNFNDKENLWRLRKCLQGPAKEAVTSLLIGATAPDLVMSTLELQFGNPDIIISKIVQSINKLPVMSQEYHKDIVSFSVKVKNYVAAVTAIGHDEYLRGMKIISVILSKLPTVLISKWVDYSYPLINEGKKPRLAILSEFLNDEALKTSKTAVILANTYGDTKRKQSDFYRSQTAGVFTVASQHRAIRASG
ncbi:uncharacterized protein LOC134743988 [Cydia strobilella]|uniref:uncharacterized protein LOC134743418 n=1 Tax=Cydia strobilella TaxID=1100964 RepID=UPI003003A878